MGVFDFGRFFASAPRGRRFSRQRLLRLWPHGPLAAAMIAVGLINLLEAFRIPLRAFREIRALNGLAESLPAVGGTAQVILGLLLVGTGIGLLRRLSLAWTLSFLLLLVGVALGLVRRHWGASFALELGMLVVLWLGRRHFTRRTVAASLVFSASNILAVLGYGVVGSYLLGRGFQPAIHDLSTALYYTVVTLSTVGYGDIVPVSNEARWFVVSLLVFGLSVFASTIVTAIGPKISRELNRLFNARDKFMKPKDHVILIGKGAIARNTAKELDRRGVPFVHIMPAPAELDHPDVRVIEGDATADTVLRQAGVESAKLAIAAREDDSENAFVVLAVKALNPNLRVLAVASSALAMRRLKLARADVVFSPAAVGSRLLADLVQGEDLRPEFRDLIQS